MKNNDKKKNENNRTEHEKVESLPPIIQKIFKWQVSRHRFLALSMNALIQGLNIPLFFGYVFNNAAVGIAVGGKQLSKKEKKFAHKYFGMWDASESIYENLEESLEVLRQAKRDSFRKIIELEDQLPKLKKEEERLRKIWRMESDKVEAIYDELKKEEKAEEERARQQKIQDNFENENTEKEAA